MADIIDSFIFGAYWGSRAESLTEIVDKTADLLTGVRNIDDQFLRYYRGGLSRKKALEHEVLLDKESITKLCLTGVKKSELTEDGYAKHGFIYGVWTGHKNDESSAITFTVGDTFETSNLSNCCVITLPVEGAARVRLLQREVGKKILATMINIWSPDYAVLTSSFLRQKLDVGNKVGWTTYNKEEPADRSVGNDLIYEEDAQGHWFYLDPMMHSIESAEKLLLPLSGKASNLLK